MIGPHVLYDLRFERYLNLGIGNGQVSRVALKLEYHWVNGSIWYGLSLSAADCVALLLLKCESAWQCDCSSPNRHDAEKRVSFCKIRPQSSISQYETHFSHAACSIEGQKHRQTQRLLSCPIPPFFRS